MRRLFMLSILAVLLALPLQAQGTRLRADDPGLASAGQARTQIDVSKLGPKVGERVPDFKLADQTGREHTLQSIMGRRGAMLVFVRSADW